MVASTRKEKKQTKTEIDGRAGIVEEVGLWVVFEIQTNPSGKTSTDSFGTRSKASPNQHNSPYPFSLPRQDTSSWQWLVYLICSIGSQIPPPLDLSDSNSGWYSGGPGGSAPAREGSQLSHYLSPTCPSYNKLDPLSATDLSSRALLSKFFSQPDDPTPSGSWQGSRDMIEGTESGHRSHRNGDVQLSSVSGLSMEARSSAAQRPQSQNVNALDRMSGGYDNRQQQSQSAFGRTEPSRHVGHERDTHGMDSFDSHDTERWHQPSSGRLPNEGDSYASTSSGNASGSMINTAPIRQVNRFGEEEFRCVAKEQFVYTIWVSYVDRGAVRTDRRDRCSEFRCRDCPSICHCDM